MEWTTDIKVRNAPYTVSLFSTVLDHCLEIQVKVKRPITRLWHVYLSIVDRYPIAYVSKTEQHDIHYAEYRKVRACTAKAAGRRILRNNVPSVMASCDYETDNFFYRQDITPDMLKRYKGLNKKGKVIVLR
jgi:hypothetical protein